VWILKSFVYIVSCHQNIMTILPLPFQFEYLLFLFLVWSLWLEVPILCWIEVVRVGMLVFFKILAERLLPLGTVLAVSLSLIAFICWAMFPLSSLIRIFIMNGCWILSNAFFLSIKMMSFFPFVDVVYYIDWLACVEPSLWPWDESSLITVYDLFYVLLNLVC